MEKIIMFSEELNREVTIYIYLPNSYDKSKKYNVVYMHDGQNLSDPALTTYGHVWQVEQSMEYNIKDFIVVGLSSPQNQNGRKDELCPYQNNQSLGLGNEYLSFLLKVVDRIDEKFSTYKDASARLLIGSSLGGLITTYAAAYYSNYFKNFACLSNAYWFAPRILEDIKYIQDVKFYMDVGTKEGNPEYVSLNDQVYSLLTNENSLYVKIPDAVHNEQEWAVRLPMILRWMFGGKE